MRHTQLGLLPFLFYAVHAGYHLLHHHPEDLLWSCHVANIAIGIGLILGRARPNAIGTLWLSIGVPLWLLDLVTGGTFIPTSLLTHVGGTAIGLFGCRTMGLPRHAARDALLALVALYIVTRLVTPRGANVNIAWAVWPGWERIFPSYPIYFALLVGLCAGAFVTAERLIRRLVLREQPCATS